MRLALVLLTAILLPGCAFTDAKLDIRHTETANFKGPMSNLPPARIEIKPLVDARNDQARIGYKKNGFGQNTADITTQAPVTEIVTGAVAAGLQRNGHPVGLPADVAISGSVTRFWFEFDPNMFTIEFIGNVECDLEFTDTKTGRSIHKGRYSGTSSKKVAAGLEGTWTEVMNGAVDKMVEDVVFDDDLIEALQARR